MNLEDFISNGLAAQRAVDQVLEIESQRANGKRARTLNPTSLVNRAVVKKRLLELSAGTRWHKFTRVGLAAVIRVNAAAEAEIRKIVRELPSKGKTI